MSRYVMFLCLGLLLQAARGGSLYQPLAGFSSGPKSPGPGRLTPHPDGNFYGTNLNLGDNTPGLIYKMSVAGEITVVARLVDQETSFGTFSATPSRGLEVDSSGRLWGITSTPSSFVRARIFHCTPASGQYVEATGFDTLPGANYTASPRSDLIPDGQGHFLFLAGMDIFSGGFETALYKLDPSSGVCTRLGANPGDSETASGLVPDGMGFIWGRTTAGNGSVYKISVSTGLRSTVATFTGEAAGAARGKWPMADLSPDGKGFLWGTTTQGGATGVGTVFKVEMATGILTTVADLPDTVTNGGLKATQTTSAMCPDGRGWMWGATALGGISDGSGYFGEGILFKVNILTGELRSLLLFADGTGPLTGKNPSIDLVRAPDGKIRGMTSRGGAANRGTVFTIDPETDTFSQLTELNGLGSTGLGTPSTTLAADNEGQLWGGARIGDQGGFGGLFTVNPQTGTMTRRLLFTGRAGAAKGNFLDDGMVKDEQGLLWGFTQGGGSADLGTVFRLDPATGVLTTVKDFTGKEDGRNPAGIPHLDGQGYVWGMTQGGDWGESTVFGTVFKIHAATGTFTTVTTFTGITGAAMGSAPNGGLSSDGLGNLWGTTFFGGMDSWGTMFKVNISSGAYTNMREFGNPSGSRPVYPRTALAADGGGFLWGVTDATGSTNGTIYKVNAATGIFTKIGEPPGSVAGELVYDGAGWLWGTDPSGIYRIARDTHRILRMHSLTGLGGAAPGSWLPSAPLMKHADGHFYGVAEQGGVMADGSPAGCGQIFRLHLGPLPRTLPAEYFSATAARIPGTVHSNDTTSLVTLEYGRDPGLAGSGLLTLAAPVVLDREQPVSAILRGLEPATTYFYRLRAVNADNANPQAGEILSFTTSPRGISPWLAGQGLSGTEALPAADPDADGLPNTMEYVLGAPARQSSTAALPRLIEVDNALVLEFQRAADAGADPGLSLSIETSADLIHWQSSKVGKTSGTSDAGITVEAKAAEYDLIRCRLPPGTGERAFVRLKAHISNTGGG